MRSIFSNSLDGLFWANDSLPTRTFQGLTIVVETPQYEMREGPGWMSAPPADYGYIADTLGADGDDMDCYLGPNPDATIVYVVDQNRIDGSGQFDEHKCMLGYDSEDEAKEDYLAGHTEGEKIFRGITPMSMPVFRKWLVDGDVNSPLGG